MELLDSLISRPENREISAKMALIALRDFGFLNLGLKPLWFLKGGMEEPSISTEKDTDEIGGSLMH